MLLTLSVFKPNLNRNNFLFCFNLKTIFDKVLHLIVLFLYPDNKYCHLYEIYVIRWLELYHII